ncbi:MAG: hypothetical protein VW307_03335 [Alphaproteobacteria bacterium]
MYLVASYPIYWLIEPFWGTLLFLCSTGILSLSHSRQFLNSDPIGIAKVVFFLALLFVLLFFFDAIRTAREFALAYFFLKAALFLQLFWFGYSMRTDMVTIFVRAYVLSLVVMCGVLILIVIVNWLLFPVERVLYFLRGNEFNSLVGTTGHEYRVFLDAVLRRPSYGNPLDMSFLVFVGMLLVLSVKSIDKKLVVIFLVLGTSAIIISGARTFLAVMLLFIIPMVAKAIHQSKRTIFAYGNITVLASLAVVGCIYFADIIKNKLRFHEFLDLETSPRFIIYKSFYDRLELFFYFGYRRDISDEILFQALGRENSSESFYLSLLSNFGLFGAMMFAVSVLAVIVISFLKLKLPFILTSLIAFGFMLIGVTFPFNDYYFFYFCAGIIVRLLYERRNFS